MAVLDRVPVDRIAAEARDVEFGRTLLKLIAGFFYLIGWLVAKLLLAVAFAWTAVKVGYLEANGPRPHGRARGPA
jgi:hypothetical protein